MEEKDEKQPLWMPRGSVRAILAFMLVGATIYFTYVDATVPDVLGTLAGTAVGFYFGARK